jgi:hypothetical protein
MQADACLRFLTIANESGLVLSPAGRIACVNAPDRPRGPRLHLSGCAGGNLVCLRDDVPEALAVELFALVRGEPNWHRWNEEPRCLSLLVDRLSEMAPVKTIELGVQHLLPHGLSYPHPARIIRSGTTDGARLEEALAARMPQPMIDAGFLTVADLWKPWCIAIEADAVASIAFAARLGAQGAAIGVYTFPGHRGRGLAAAVTAAWSQLPELESRVLFYGARQDNRSSRRVIERLALAQIGATLAID